MSRIYPTGKIWLEHNVSSGSISSCERHIQGAEQGFAPDVWK